MVYGASAGDAVIQITLGKLNPCLIGGEQWATSAATATSPKLLELDKKDIKPVGVSCRKLLARRRVLVLALARMSGASGLYLGAQRDPASTRIRNP